MRVKISELTLPFLVATNDHSEYDCFACAILTHGDTNDVLYAHDGKLHLKDFTTPFESQNCPSLAEKPKLFFIQVSDISYCLWSIV